MKAFSNNLGMSVILDIIRVHYGLLVCGLFTMKGIK